MGLQFLKRDSGGGLLLISYHPKKYPTWAWFIGWNKRHDDFHGKWFDFVNLSHSMNGRYVLVLFQKWELQLQTQSYHKQRY